MLAVAPAAGEAGGLAGALGVRLTTTLGVVSGGVAAEFPGTEFPGTEFPGIEFAGIEFDNWGGRRSISNSGVAESRRPSSPR